MNDLVGGAQHVVSRLMRESLMDKALIAGTESPVRAILPDLNVVQIGGLSIMDRGHTALMPLLDEIVANQQTHTQVVGVGPGVRARHILSVGLDLGLPTGALANARRKELGAERLHGVVPARRARLRLPRGAVHRAAPASHAGGRARRCVQRHPALRSLGAPAGDRKDPAARERCRIVSGGRGVRCPQRRPA